MDTELSDSIFEQETRKLRDVMSGLSPESEITIEGRTIFVNLSSKDGKRYLLRIDCNENFPLEPPIYKFVNPVTRLDDNIVYWPNDGQQSFKTNEPVRWICIAGTRDYKNRHGEHRFDLKTYPFAQTVFHILRQINGWSRVE